MTDSLEETPHPTRGGWKKRRRGPPSPLRACDFFELVSIGPMGGGVAGGTKSAGKINFWVLPGIFSSLRDFLAGPVFIYGIMSLWTTLFLKMMLS